jgi:hypothetical protein
MRKVLGIIICVSLTGCQALRVDQGGDGASVLSLRLGTLRHEDGRGAPCHEDGRGAPYDDNGMGLREGSTYEAHLTTQCPQGMASSMAPAHTVQAIIPGPNGPSVAYLEFPDGMPSQPPAVQAAFNAPAPSDSAVRAIQNELTEQICKQVIDLKQQVQDLTSQVKTRPEPIRDSTLETIAANVAALNQQVNKLNEGLASLKAIQERPASAASTSTAPQEAPAKPAAAPAPSPICPVSAQSVQPPPLFTANEPIDLTQKEVNLLVTQCVFELKSEIRDLNARLTKLPGATKSGE